MPLLPATGGAFPEELRVGAAHVVGVQRQRVDQLILLRKAQTEMANCQRENWRDDMDRLRQSHARRPLRSRGDAFRVGGEPLDALGASDADNPFYELFR